MTNVILSFDTEDIVNERGADGILRCARILREEGIRGCFNIIGLLPDVLKKWGRDDIFDELKYHEIDFHSNKHSVHPTINEYTDIESYYEALEKFLTDETEGMEKVKSAFSRERLPAACIPGNCTSYVAHYGYADAGFKFFSGDSIYDKVSYRPIYNCNVVSLHYARSLDGVLFRLNENSIPDFINETARGKDVMIFYHHPQRAYCKSFWDADNFNATNTPKERWIKSEIHDNAETEYFYKNFRTFIRALRDDGEFEIITYGELEKKLVENTRKIDLDTLKRIRPMLNESFFPITNPNSYCIADIFLACATLICKDSPHVCGKVYGFLSTPYSVTKETRITKEEAISLAKSIQRDEFLPPVFSINGKEIGPRDLLDAFLAFLLDGADSYMAKPNAPWQIDLDQFPSLRDLNYKASWISGKDLKDEFLSDRLRLQSWTIRLPKNSERFIFN
ncbi:MAG: hypothetical protein IJD73_02480 [Clostridia bacterium]|nr:hypothetical protein [Clostridia bacterium]